MNIYFNMFNYQSNIGIAKVIAAKYANGSHIITTYEEGIDANFEDLDMTILDCAQIQQNRYFDYPVFKDAPPLDETSIDAARHFEAEAIKMMERFNPFGEGIKSFDERTELFHSHLRYWSFLLENKNIGLALFVNTPHSGFDYIVYQLCKLKGIPTLLCLMGPFWEIKTTYFMEDIHDHCPEAKQELSVLQKEYKDTPIDKIPLDDDIQKAFQFYADPKRDKTPGYMKKKVEKKSFAEWYKSLSYITLTSYYILKNGRYALTKEQRELHRQQYFWSKYLKKGTQWLQNKYDALATPVDLNEKYIYFPLHYQPENTTCPLGGIFVWQLLAIQMLSFYLPDGHKVYVKEHPNQKIWCRDPQLYENIVKLHNVQLVPREENTFDLIKNCVAVASVTGTAGMEGLFEGKPFIMFGYFINNYAPGVYVVRNKEDCEQAIKKIIKDGATHTIKDLKLYFKAVGNVSVHATAIPDAFPVEISLEENESRMLNAFNERIEKIIKKGVSRKI